MLLKSAQDLTLSLFPKYVLGNFSKRTLIKAALKDNVKFEEYKYNNSLWLECVWTILPCVVLILIAIPSFCLLSSMDEVIDPVITLNEKIEINGAETILFLTWGRQNGDKKNPEIYPDFLTMQSMLNKGKRKRCMSTCFSP